MLHLTSCECLGPVDEVGNKKAQSLTALGEVAERVCAVAERPPSEHAKQDQDQHDN
jgi:hypothetical protein